MALVSRPVIFLQILAARAVDDGGSSLITVFKPTTKTSISTLLWHFQPYSAAKRILFLTCAIIIHLMILTLSLPNTLLSAKFFYCFNFQSASKSLVGENVVCVSNSLDSDETLGVSSGSKLFAYGTSVVLGWLGLIMAFSCICMY